jgi:demethylmenaquinone methyltransferase/2-methoxy-6-polyprenyl-1,4-benzoquinol methylase
MNTDTRLELVERFFAGTGTTYDLIVNLCTAGIDAWWKRQMLARLPSNPQRIVDLAAGTGILTFAIAKRFPECHVTGVELRPEYLDIARARAARERGAHAHGAQVRFTNVEWILSRAEDVRLQEPVDAVTSSYLAKYADLPRLAQAMNGMLREGGLVLAHDFTYPHVPLRWVWELYFKLLPPVGSRILPQWCTIFYELPGLIRRTTWVADMVHALQTEGFVDIQFESLTMGGAGLLTARKGSAGARPASPAPTGSHPD